MRMIDRENKVVNFLTLIDGWAGDYKLHHWTNCARERTTSLCNQGQRRIVDAIHDKNNFETRIVLSEDRGDVLAQSIINPAQRHEHGDERREFRIFLS